MDENRPMPNGSLFDVHREKDYLRRREEGFSPPCIRVEIVTPEWKEAETKYNDTEVRFRYE